MKAFKPGVHHAKGSKILSGPEVGVFLSTETEPKTLEMGDAIADIVTKLHLTGNHPGLQSMRKDMPSDALEMLSIPGLRSDKVLKILQ